jgi:RNA polymerase sigma-70 factor (ECF subfamily)
MAMASTQLRALLEQHHRESYGWALTCCRRDLEAAENALQSAYLEVLEGRAVFHGDARFKTWLFAVIRNHARRERRRRFWLVRRSVSWEPAREPAGPGPALDDAAYGREMQALLQKGLGSMPGRQREILQLVFYHELSVAEAGDVLGISLGSARRYYDRGKKRLRRFLEEATEHHAVGPAKDLAAVPRRETCG